MFMYCVIVYAHCVDVITGRRMSGTSARLRRTSRSQEDKMLNEKLASPGFSCQRQLIPT